MPVPHLPPGTADALAAFVEHRARQPARLQPLAQPGAQPITQPLAMQHLQARGWLELVQRYRRAVREGEVRRAGRLERALLQVALAHRDHPDFERSWSHWYELLRAFDR